jgi:pyrrolysyl-tRNA synthetase-like protein
MAQEKKSKKPAKRYYRKRVELFRLIDKIKLWPSRRGILHGIKTIEKRGDQAQVTTHCNKSFMVTDSRNSRAARWLRNKWFKGVCGKCRVPEWKLEKYSSTQFRRHYGSHLLGENERGEKR